MTFNFRLLKSLDERTDAGISLWNGSWSNPRTKARPSAANGFWSKLKPRSAYGGRYSEGYGERYEEIHGTSPDAGREAQNAKCQVVGRAFR